jgi:protein TonB
VILSLAGHIIGLTLLIFFVTETSPPPQPLEKSGIAVVIAPLDAQPQATLAPAQPPQPIAPPAAARLPPDETVPPQPAPQTPPVTAVPVPLVPPEETVTAEAPPPPPKPAVRPKPKLVVRRQEPVQPPLPPAPRYTQAAPPAFAAASYATGSSAPRTLAASVPGPDPAVNYRAMISAWLESHKRYPESARERGEEGSVGLRFRVDRYGRVIGYALLNSSGYADLDEGVQEMMSGAQLPPFPPSMTMLQIEVLVRIGFNLTR